MWYFVLQLNFRSFNTPHITFVMFSKFTITYNRWFYFKQSNSPKKYVMPFLWVKEYYGLIIITYLIQLKLLPHLKNGVIRKGWSYDNYCQGFPLKISNVHRLWLAGRIPPGWRSLYPELREPVTLLKTKIGKQDNRFSPLLLTPDSYDVSGGCML